MKNCKFTPTDFLPIVRDLTISDSKYFDFKEAASFFLQADRLSNTAKAIVVSNLSALYSEASAQIGDPEFTSRLGDMELMTQTYSLARNYATKPEEFINAVGALFSVAVKTQTRSTMLDREFKELINQGNNASFMEYRVFFKRIATYFRDSRQGAELDAAFEDYIESFEADVLPFIMKFHKDGVLIQKEFEAFKRKNLSQSNAPSSFVSISNAPDILGTSLVTLRSGRVVEARQQNDSFFELNGTLISPESILRTREAHPAPSEFSAEEFEGALPGDEIIRFGDINSGFRIINLKSNSGNMVERLGADLNALTKGNRYRIKAVRDLSYMPARLDRIQATEGLSSRVVETFENAEQIQLLSSGQRKEVSTVYRGANTLTLFIEDQETGDVVLLYGPSNRALLDNQNNATPIDWTNPDHVVRFAATAKINIGGKQAIEMNAEHLERIRHASETFDGFQKAVLANNTQEGVADVTDTFFESYNFQTKNVASKSKSNPNQLMSADQFLNRFPDFKRTVSVGVINPVTGQMTTTQKEVVLVFEKAPNLESMVKTMSDEDLFNNLPIFPRAFLGTNETVLDAQGNPISVSDYFRSQTTAKQYAQWLRAGFSKSSLGVFTVIGIDDRGNLSHRAALPRSGGQSIATTMNWINMLQSFRAEVASLSNEQRQEQLREMFIEKMPFRPYNGMGATVFVSPKGTLQVKISDVGDGTMSISDPNTVGFFGTISDDTHLRKLMNISNGVFGAGKSQTFEALQQFEEFKKFKKEDLKDPETSREFFETLEDFIIDNQNDPWVRGLNQSIRETINDFIRKNLVAKAVRGALKDMQAKDPALHAQFESRSNTKFRELLLVGEFENFFDPVQTDAKFHRYSMRLTDSGVDLADINNYFVYAPAQEDNRLSVGLNNPSPQVIAQNQPAPSVQVEAQEEAIEETPLPESTVSMDENATEFDNQLEEESSETESQADDYQTGMFDDLDDGAVFSLSRGEEGLTRTQEDAQKEEEWLRSRLPQYGLTTADLSQVFENVTLDEEVNVLGAFYRDTIYLDRNLARKGTLYHEAFHGVFRNHLSFEDRYRAMDEVMYSAEHADSFTPEAIAEFRSERGLSAVSDYGVRELIAEEILADKFQAFMNKKQKPQTTLDKIFDILRKILNFVRGESESLKLFNRIDSGFYRDANVIRSSENAENSPAFQLIRSRISARNKFDNSGVEKRWSNLSPSLQKQMAFKLANEVLAIGGDSLQDIRKNREDIFRQARKNVAERNYDISKYVEGLNPEAEAEVRRKFQEDFDDARTVLGWDNGADAGIKSINHTGSEKFSYPSSFKALSEADQNRMRAFREEGTQILERQAMEIVLRMAVPTSEREEAQEEANEIAEQKEAATNKKDNWDRDEQGDNADFDSNFLNLDLLESIPNELRRFFGTIEYADTHVLKAKDENGNNIKIDVPTTVDATFAFGLMMKIASDTPPFAIFNKIKSSIEDYRYDENTEIVAMLEAVVDRLERQFSVDAKGGVTGNKRLYYQLLDAFSVTQMDASLLQITTRSTIQDNVEQKTTTVKKTEALLRADINNRRNKITGELRNKNSEAHNDDSFGEEYTAAALNLGLLIQKANKTDKSLIPVTAVTDNQKLAALEEVTSSIKGYLDTVGFNVPRSLVRLSVLGNEVNHFDKIIDQNHAFGPLVQENYEFIKMRQYLDIDGLRALALALYNNIKSGDRSLKNLSEANDPLAFSAKSNIIPEMMRKSSQYIVRRDPSINSSTTINADGKKIFRFTKYTPATLMVQELREKGVERYIKEMDYGQIMEDFMSANPLVQFAKEGDFAVTPEANALNIRRAEAALFMKNLSVAVNAGFSHTEDGDIKRSASFKNYTSPEKHTTALMNFLQRETQTELVRMIDPKTGEEILQEIEVETFGRLFNTLEASQTSFQIDALKMNLAKSNNGPQSMSRVKIATRLKDIFLQEFERIARESATIQDRLDRYNQGTATAEQLNLINKYNAKLDSKGNAVTDPSLRAFNFMYFQDLFQVVNSEKELDAEINGPEAVEVRDKFLALASTGELEYGVLENDETKAYTITLDSMLNTLRTGQGSNPAEQALLNELFNLFAKKGGYIDRKQDEYKQELENHGLIQTVEIPGFPTQVKLKGIPERVYRNGKGKHLYGTSASEYASLNDALEDFYWNFLFNHTFINQIFEGDRAMGIKNQVDLVKRNKAFLGAGSAGKSGTYRVAVVDELYTLVNEEFIEDGQFDLLSENAGLNAEKLRSYKQPVADGQAFISINHRIQLFEDAGRMSDEVRNIMIASQVRPLTTKERATLRDNKSMLNSLKTVHGAAESYFKYSEMNVARADVSTINYQHPDFIVPGPVRLTKKDIENYIIDIYQKVDNLYAEVRLEEQLGQTPRSMMLRDQIRQHIQKAHQYFIADPARVDLHNLLNSMEYHQIDSLMDTNASKKTTVLPVRIQDPNAGQKMELVNGYHPLDKAGKTVSTRYKMLQVETSGVADKVKNSVQAKVLITADLLELIADLQAKGESSIKSSILAEELESLQEKYYDTLTNGAKVRLRELFSVNRHDSENGKPGDLRIEDIYTNIQDSLIMQGADQDAVDLFDLDANGKIKNNPNLPDIRQELENYLVAHYNKVLFDEKINGFKMYHATSYGMRVMEDTQTGQVVPTSDRRARKIQESDRFKLRNLGVQKSTRVLDLQKIQESDRERVAEIQQLNDLYRLEMDLAVNEDAISSEQVPQLYILDNLPKITTESAERETGGKVGVKKDISPAFISNANGVSVERAAEMITEDAPAGFTWDESDVRNEIIEILQTGIVKYREEYDRGRELRIARQDIAALQKKHNITSPAEAQAALRENLDNDNQITQYTVEIMIPDPGFKTEQERKFFMAKANEMFGTRIPTEDKRSMIAFKVVDFLDASHENTVVAPMIVHLLSGSDLDIDSLYVQAKAYYKDLMGEYRLYGDYAHSSDNVSETEMRYFEKLSSLSNDRTYKKKIKKQADVLFNSERFIDYVEDPENEGQFNKIYRATAIAEAISAEPSIRRMLKVAGINDGFLEAIPVYLERAEVLKEQSDLYEQIREVEQMDPDEIDIEGAIAHIATMLKEVKKTKGDPLKEGIIAKAGRLISAKDIARFSRFGLHLLASFDVLISEKAIPKYQTFSRQEVSEQWNKKALQNDNLQAKIDILKNEAVFKQMYKDERATAEDLVKVVDELFGVDPKDVVRYLNASSITAQVIMSDLNTASKGGVGIAANFNKFLAVATGLNLELANNKVLWHYEESGQKKRAYNFLHGVDNRAISLVGNMLGMFADAAKEPIPGILGIDDQANGMILFQVALGIKPALAVRLSMVKGFKNATKLVEEADNQGQRLYLANEISKQANELLKGDKLARMEFDTIVESSGFIGPKGRLNKASAFTIKYKAVDRKLDLSKRQTGASVEELGLDVVPTGGGTITNPKVKEAIILHLLSEQARQNSQLLSIGGVVNLHKPIRPDVDTVVRFSELGETLANDRLFKNQEVLLSDNLPYATLIEGVQDLKDQMGKIFLDMHEDLFSLNSTYAGAFGERSSYAQELTGNLVSRRVRKTMVKLANEKGNPSRQAKAQMFLSMGSPEYWFGIRSKKNGQTLPGILEDYDLLQTSFPNNKFVQALRLKSTMGKARAFYHLELPNMKFDASTTEDINNGFDELFNHPEAIVRDIALRLFYHEIYRNGLSRQKSSFLRHMNAQLRQSVLGEAANEVAAAIDASGIAGLETVLAMEGNTTAVYQSLHEDLVNAAASRENNRVPGLPARVANLEGLNAGTTGLEKMTDLFAPSFALDFTNLSGAPYRSITEMLNYVKANMVSEKEYEFQPVLRRKKRDRAGKVMQEFEYLKLTSVDGVTPGVKLNEEGVISGLKATYEVFNPKSFKNFSNASFSAQTVEKFEDFADRKEAVNEEQIVRESSIRDLLKKRLIEKAYTTKQARQEC